MPSKFRPGRKSGGGGGDFDKKTRVEVILTDVAKANGYTYVDNRLTTGKVTTFRILPSVDPETGELDLALNPDATPDMDFGDKVGRTCYQHEVCRDVGGNVIVTFLSGIRETRDGSTVHDGWSASRIMMRRFGYKLAEAHVMKKAGMETNVPRAWLSWHSQYAVRDPLDWIFCQALVWERNGEIHTDLQTGQQGWLGPCVFAIPASARKGFAHDITTPLRAGEPLSLNNNLFGDFCSQDMGAKLMLNKLVEKNRAGEDQTSYRITKLEPSPLPAGYCEQVWKPWEQILRAPKTVEDELAMLAYAFDWAAVDYGLSGNTGDRYYDYIPDEHKGSGSHLGDAMSPDELKALAQSSRGQGTASAPVQGHTPPAPPPSPRDDTQAPPPAHTPAPVPPPVQQQAPPPVQQQQQAPPPVQQQQQQQASPPVQQQNPPPPPFPTQQAAPPAQSQAAPPPANLPPAPVPNRPPPQQTPPPQTQQAPPPQQQTPPPMQQAPPLGGAPAAAAPEPTVKPDNPDLYEEALANLEKLKQQAGGE